MLKFPALFILIFYAGLCGLGSDNFRNSSYKEKTAGLACVSRLSFRFFMTMISCMGRNLRLNVILRIAVMDFLNDRTLIATCFDPLRDSVWLATGAYLSGVWSKFITKDGGMEWRTTRSALWCCNISLAFFFFCQLWVFRFGCGACSFRKTHASN